MFKWRQPAKFRAFKFRISDLFRISDFGFRIFVSAFFLCLAATLSGCITKAKADAQARAAFVAGEQQAMRNMEQVKARGPSVMVVGQVRNPRVPWTAELTLAKAVLAAEYFGEKDPTEILIVRSGKAIRYDPKKLLAGEDMPLEPQDLIELKQ